MYYNIALININIMNLYIIWLAVASYYISWFMMSLCIILLPTITFFRTQHQSLSLNKYCRFKLKLSSYIMNNIYCILIFFKTTCHDSYLFCYISRCRKTNLNLNQPLKSIEITVTNTLHYSFLSIEYPFDM